MKASPKTATTTEGITTLLDSLTHEQDVWVNDYPFKMRAQAPRSDGDLRLDGPEGGRYYIRESRQGTYWGPTIGAVRYLSVEGPQ